MSPVSGQPWLPFDEQRPQHPPRKRAFQRAPGNFCPLRSCPGDEFPFVFRCPATPCAIRRLTTEQSGRRRGRAPGTRPQATAIVETRLHERRSPPPKDSHSGRSIARRGQTQTICASSNSAKHGTSRRKLQHSARTSRRRSPPLSQRAPQFGKKFSVPFAVAPTRTRRSENSRPNSRVQVQPSASATTAGQKFFSGRTVCTDLSHPVSHSAVPAFDSASSR